MSDFSYNLGGIREAIFAQMGWAPNTDPVNKERLNLAINRAMWRLCQEMPSAFFEEVFEIRTEGDVVPTLSTDTLRVEDNGDQWVLRTELAVGSGVAWETGRRWAGKKLYVDSSSTSETQEIEIREVWTQAAPDQATYYYVSLKRPWHNSSDTGMTWRIHTESQLPADVVEVKGMWIHRDQTERSIAWIGKSHAEWATYAYRGTRHAVGQPVIAYHREFKTLQAPTFTPTVTTYAQPAVGQEWAGPEPEGKFEYLFTYVFGAQELFLVNPGPSSQTAAAPITQRHEAYLESGASPISAQIEPTTNGSAASEIVVGLPNMAFMLGFDDNSVARYRRTGIRKRIYRRRLSDTGFTGVSTTATIESPNTFYLLAEVDAHETSFVDDGTLTPDYHTPFRHIGGFQAIEFYPVPENDDYSLRVRAVRRPRELTDDQDVPPCHLDAVNCVIYAAAAIYYEQQSNPSGAAKAHAQYEELLQTLRRRYTDGRPASRPRRRKVARVRKPVRFLRTDDPTRTL